jgi:hypothetical protein
MEHKSIQELKTLVPAFDKLITAKPNVLEIIEAFIGAKGSSLGHFVYQSKNEIMKVVASLGVSYPNARKNDLEKLLAVDLTIVTPLRKQAIEKLIESADDSVNSPPKPNDTYYGVEGTNGIIKVHRETGNVYIVGFVNKKNTLVLMEEYKKVNSSALTIEKRKVEKELGLRGPDYRNYIIDPDAKLIRCSGNSFIFESDVNLIVQLIAKHKQKVLSRDEYELILEAVEMSRTAGVPLTEGQIKEIVKTVEGQSQSDFNLTKEQVEKMIEEIHKDAGELSEDSE